MIGNGLIFNVRFEVIWIETELQTVDLQGTEFVRTEMMSGEIEGASVRTHGVEASTALVQRVESSTRMRYRLVFEGAN